MAFRVRRGVQERSELRKKPMDAIVSTKDRELTRRVEKVVQLKKESDPNIASIRSPTGAIRSSTAL